MATPDAPRPGATAAGAAAPPPATAEPAPDRRWLALVVIAVAQLMVALDATIVNIALPSAQRALDFADRDRQWVVTAYTLTFAGLLLVGGRVADHLGRRRAFLVGLAGFAASSALAGSATSLGMLLAGRGLQGAFAALLAPTALSLVAVTFTEPAERARAFGVYGAVASSGAATGLLLGGALTEYLDWRWCLFVNVGVAVAALAAGRAVLPAPPVRTGGRIDALGAALATGGLAAVVYGCAQAVPHGWVSPGTLGPLGGGLAAIALFLARQAASAAPVLPLHLLRDRARAGAYLSVAISVVGSFGTFLMLTYYFQVVLRYSPLKAGLAFLPLTVSVAASAYGIASRALPRVAPRALVAPGLAVAAAGLVLLGRLGTTGGYATLVLPAEVLLGIGMGCVFTPAISVATSGVQPRDAGIAAAVANTASQIGGSIGTAVLNTLAVTATRAYLRGHAPGPGAGTAALVHGYATATTWAAAALGVTAVLALVLVNSPRPAARGGHGTPATSPAAPRPTGPAAR